MFAVMMIKILRAAILQCEESTKTENSISKIFYKFRNLKTKI